MVTAQYTSILNSKCYATQKGKEGTLQAVVAVAVAVPHLWMMSLQKGKKQQIPRSIQTLSKKHSF